MYGNAQIACGDKVQTEEFKNSEILQSFANYLESQ